MNLEKLISFFFHPVFMPFLMFHLVLITLPEISTSVSFAIELAYWIVIISSIIIPLTATCIFIRLNKKGSLEMVTKKERVVPLLYSSCSMFIGCLFLNNLFIYAPILLSMFFGASIISLFASMISFFWKISLHMLGVGGSLGAFIALGLLYNNFLGIIIVFIFISGCVGYARLKSGSHNESQIYIGFFLGVFIEVLITVNYSSVISVISIFLSSIAPIL